MNSITTDWALRRQAEADIKRAHAAYSLAKQTERLIHEHKMNRLATPDLHAAMRDLQSQAGRIGYRLMTYGANRQCCFATPLHQDDKPNDPDPAPATETP